MWGRRDVLFVHFLNPEILHGWKCGGAPLDVNNILGWAEAWNTKTDSVPTFEETDSPKRADIRVTFGGKN